MSKKIMVTMLMLIKCIVGYSQGWSFSGVTAGYGYYESVNAGIICNIKDNKHKTGLSVGFDNYLRPDETYMAVTAEYDISVFRQRMRNSDYKWYIGGKMLYWHLSDNYYNWDVLSLSPTLQRVFYLTDRISLGIDAGPMFNIILHFKRKTFKEIGWPYHVMPNYRVQLAYCF